MSLNIPEIGPLKKARDLIGLKLEEIVLDASEEIYVGKYTLLKRVMSAVEQDSVILGYLTDVLNSMNESVSQDNMNQLIVAYVRGWLEGKETKEKVCQ